MSITRYDRHLIVDGVDTGLVLARDKGGAPMWSRTQRSMYQGKDIIWQEDDWREGLSSGGYGCDDRIKGWIIAPPKVNDLDLETPNNTLCFCVHNGELFCGTYASGGVYKLSDGAWVLSNSLGDNGCTDLCSFTDSAGTNYLLAAAYNGYWYSTDDGDNWQQSTLSGDDAQALLFAAIGTTVYKAYDGVLYSSTDPSNDGSWDTGESFGWTNTDIRMLLAHNDELFIWKDEGLYINNGNEWVLAAEELTTLQSVYSGVNAIAWKGYIYFQMGENTIYYYSPEYGYVDTITPAGYAPEETRFKGRCVALAADEEWLYAFLDNDTNVELMAGRWEDVSDVGTDFRWHHLTTIAYATLYAAIVENVSGNKCLWLGGYEGDGIKYIILPDRYPDIPNATDYKFDTGGVHYTGKYDAGVFDEYKTFKDITLKTDDATALALDGTNRKILVEYQDDEGDWYEIGEFTESPLQTLKIGDTGMTFLETRLRFTMTNGESATPKIKGFILRGKLRTSRKVNVYNFTVLCADRLIGDRQTAKDIADAINSADRPEPVIIEDENGTQITMMFTEVKEEYMYQEKSRTWEKIFTIQAEELV